MKIWTSFLKKKMKMSSAKYQPFFSHLNVSNWQTTFAQWVLNLKVGCLHGVTFWSLWHVSKSTAIQLVIFQFSLFPRTTSNHYGASDNVQWLRSLWSKDTPPMVCHLSLGKILEGRHQFHHEDHFFRYRDFHYKDKTAMRLSYLYNGNSLGPSPVLGFGSSFGSTRLQNS